MDTIAVTLSVPSFDQEAALAALPLDGLNGVLQEDDRLVLYVAADAWTDAQEATLRT
mgnify:FL=1